MAAIAQRRAGFVAPAPGWTRHATDTSLTIEESTGKMALGIRPLSPRMAEAARACSEDRARKLEEKLTALPASAERTTLERLIAGIGETDDPKRTRHERLGHALSSRRQRATWKTAGTLKTECERVGREAMRGAVALWCGVSISTAA